MKSRISSYYRRSWAVVVMSVMLTLIAEALYRIPVMTGLEEVSRDLRFRMFPIPAQADTSIVLVSIDDNCLAWSRSNHVPWPYPRDFYGLVVDYLSDGGAESILFDMQFTDPDFDRAETLAEQTDSAFAEAIARSGRVVLGTQLVPDTTAIPVDLKRFAITCGNAPVETKLTGVLSPLPIFRNAARRIGIINVEPDADGVIRRVPVIFDLKGMRLPQMALAALPDSLFSSERHGLRVGNRVIPLDWKGQYRVNWYGSGGDRSPFPAFSMGAVLQSAAQHAAGFPETLPAERFRGKSVIIGATAGGLLDLKTVPTDRIYPGMEIWATLLSNFRQGDFLRTLPLWAIALWLLLVILGVGLSFARLQGRGLTLSLLILMAISPVLSLIAFAHWRLDIPVVLPSLGFIIACLFTSTLYYFMEGRARREIRAVFSRYLSPDVVGELVRDPDAIEMGGEEVEATTLFTDIANFTHISESFTPRELVTHLNQYFTEFVDIILQHHGLLDKYTGDGLMALFGVPVNRPDHAIAACRVALAHKALCASFPADEARQTVPQKFHLHTRIGINTARIVAGNIGSAKRIDYTAIGDGVNLAARLEGVNKIYRTSIMISETTYAAVRDVILCRELDILRVKGKDEPTRVYEVVGEIGTESGWITRYADGLALYRAGKWDEAITVFDELIAQRNDSASYEMKRRCLEFRQHPPSDWDGIRTLESK
jgi:adenylate cyclase